MCEDCTQIREEVKNDLLAAISGQPCPLTEVIDAGVEAGVEEINKRIDRAVNEGNVSEEKRPDEAEVRAAVRDCLLAAVLATGAATIAHHTPGYTDEGKMPRSLILGQWAGMIFQNEQNNEDELAEKLLRHLLGMGDN